MVSSRGLHVGSRLEQPLQHIQLLLLLLLLQSSCAQLASSSRSWQQQQSVISDGLNDVAGAGFDDPTDLASSGCHRAVDKDGFVRFLVLDAGSTGTRAVLHQFQVERPKSSAGLHGSLLQYRHLNLSRFSSSPGLSAFRNFPERCRSQVSLLLAKASAALPPDQRGRTCVALRATAGLRMLESGSRRRILKAAGEALADSVEFLAPNIGAAKVLTGREEARFAWLSVNYILGRFENSAEVLATASLLEMGGGSTQVAYEAPDGELSALPPTSASAFSLASAKRRRLRTRSYLGLGIQESVLRFVGFQSERASSDSSPIVRVYGSRCVAGNLTLNFSFGPINLKLRGLPRDSNSNASKECMAQAGSLMESLNVRHEPCLSNKGPLYAISGPYHLLKYLYNIAGRNVSYSHAACSKASRGKMCKSYATTVGFIASSAELLCHDPPKYGRYEPYYCINMAVLSALLKRFNLEDDVAVIGLGGSESLGWTLGFSWDALMQSVTASSAAAHGLHWSWLLLLLFRQLCCFGC